MQNAPQLEVSVPLEDQISQEQMSWETLTMVNTLVGIALIILMYRVRSRVSMNPLRRAVLALVLTVMSKVFLLAMHVVITIAAGWLISLSWLMGMIGYILGVALKAVILVRGAAVPKLNQLATALVAQLSNIRAFGTAHAVSIYTAVAGWCLSVWAVLMADPQCAPFLQVIVLVLTWLKAWCVYCYPLWCKLTILCGSLYLHINYFHFWLVNLTVLYCDSYWQDVVMDVYAFCAVTYYGAWWCFFIFTFLRWVWNAFQAFCVSWSSEVVLARILANPAAESAAMNSSWISGALHSSPIVRWLGGWDDMTIRAVDEALNWRASDVVFPLDSQGAALVKSTDAYIREKPKTVKVGGQKQWQSRAELYRCFMTFLRTSKITHCERALTNAQKKTKAGGKDVVPLPRDNLEFSGGKTAEIAMRAVVDHRMGSPLYLIHCSKNNSLDIEALRRALLNDYRSLECAYGFSPGTNFGLGKMVAMYVVLTKDQWQDMLQVRGPETRVLSATVALPQ
jgi:hypothetical protein